MANTATAPVVNDSLMERLKAKRAELQADRDIVLEVPGWDGLLHARYGSLPWESVRKHGAKDTVTPADELVTAWSTLTDACQGILTPKDGTGELIPLGDPQCRYDESLARMIGDDTAKTPHEVIDSVFPNEMALMMHFGQYMEWLSFASDETDAELGKGSAQTTAST